jgi:hypothetical protein
MLIRCKHIYNFLCSMLLLHQSLYVLFTLHGIFYAFSGTNLLTRCHSASSFFLLYLYFRKFVHKIFSELNETKPEVPIFLSRTWGPKKRRRRAPRWSHHRVVWAPWLCLALVWAPRAPTDLALPPINCPRGENPRGIGLHPQKVPQRRRHRSQVLGNRSLYSGTLPGRGIALESSPSTPPPSSMMLLTPMMRRE